MSLFPLRWRKIIRIYRMGGLGDCIAVTPIAIYLREKFPHARIEFYCTCPDWFKNLTAIDQAFYLESFAGLSFWQRAFALLPSYEWAIPFERHVVDVYAESIGLRAPMPAPALAKTDPDVTARIRKEIGSPGLPVVCVTTAASAWTPNKAWPEQRWKELVARLAQSALVVEVGVPPQGSLNLPDPNYRDRTGFLPPEELIALVSMADLVVSPITSLTHLAAAVGAPALILVSGYEGPKCAVYPGQNYVYEQTSCAPCWLRTTCPHGIACMSGIAVERVWETAQSILAAEHPQFYPAR